MTFELPNSAYAEPAALLRVPVSMTALTRDAAISAAHQMDWRITVKTLDGKDRQTNCAETHRLV